jgi:hypothetical protein
MEEEWGKGEGEPPAPRYVARGSLGQKRKIGPPGTKMVRKKGMKWIVL